MQRRRTPPITRRPHGVATIFVVVVLLLAVGLILLYTVRGTVAEYRLSANEVRAKQALAAANAGIDHALAHLHNGGLDHDKDGAPDILTALTLTATGGTASTYKVVFADSGSTLPACPASSTGAWGTVTAPTELTAMVAVSCGWSDDNTSALRVVQRLTSTPSTRGTVTTPLVSRASTDMLTGGTTIMNYFNDLTVWSGGALLATQANPTTFVRNVFTHPTVDPTVEYRLPANVNSPNCTNPPTGYTCSTTSTVQGHDVIVSDTNLGNMTKDAYFEYFMGQAPTLYRTNTATWVVDVNNTLPDAEQNSDSLASIKDMTDNTIWIEGDATISTDLGTPEKPVVLIVNGNLNLGGGNTEINGLVYVTGNVTSAGGGNTKIYGGLIGADGANLQGNLVIIYDPNVLRRAQRMGKATRVQGGWRDW